MKYIRLDLFNTLRVKANSDLDNPRTSASLASPDSLQNWGLSMLAKCNFKVYFFNGFVVGLKIKLNESLLSK